MKQLRWIDFSPYKNWDENAEGPNFLSNELRYIRWDYYPRSSFPNSFRPVKLVTLKLSFSLQKQLWKGYKYLPHLKVLVLRHMKNLLNTPNFDQLSCLQKLTLYRCKELREIHPSLGRHTSLEYVSVSDCFKLRMFPTIVHMGKLQTLEITHCHKSLEFPEIKSNMESLVKLNLGDMGIDVLLSSVGDRCPNLISVDLVLCSYSKNKEVNLYGLKHLEEFKLHVRNRLKMLDRVYISWLTGKVVFGRDWYRCRRSNFGLRLLFPQLTHSIRKLDLVSCHLKNGEIPSDIGKLANLLELDLSYNDFTRLDFSLSKLTRLKVLTLSDCKWLVELPKLPSGIVILKANFCKSLTTVGEFYTNCNWLCEVSLLRGGVVTDGSRLLQSMQTMLEVRSRAMILKLEGVEIIKGFRAPLVRGNRCRLKLPENWSNDYSGFLMCAVGGYEVVYYRRFISMVQLLSDMDSDVVWEESDKDERTVVWYVSFASLRHTAWWNPACKEVLFTLLLGVDELCSGFGVKLVGMKSGSGPSTTKEESEFSEYMQNFIIVQDSQHNLNITFPFN